MKINLNAQLTTKSNKSVSINPSVDGHRFFMTFDLNKLREALKDKSLSKANKLALQYQLKLCELILEEGRENIDINFRINIQDDSDIDEDELEDIVI